MRLFVMSLVLSRCWVAGQNGLHTASFTPNYQTTPGDVCAAQVWVVGGCSSFTF